MGVTVVSGRSGSGKSRFVMAHIASLIADPFVRVLVVVPGQLTFETEKHIMEACGVQGIFGLQVMSIQRLAMKVIEDTGACDFISGAERAMIASRALSKMARPFHGADTQPDFEACAAELIARLKSHRQTPQRLREAAKRVRDSALAKKLIDSAALLENYDAISAGRVDFADIYTVAAQRAKDADLLRSARIVIDGLDSTTPAVMAFLAAVMALGADTVAAFRGAGGGGDDELFSSERADMLRFIEAAEQAGQEFAEVTCGLPNRHGEVSALSFLEANLYKYPYTQFENRPEGISMTETQTAEDEADALCAGILEEVRAGARFRDIAVAAGRLDSYLPLIKVKFSLCGIPYFADERRSLADNIFFDFLYSALCAAAGDMTAVPAYMLSIFSPLTDDQRREMDAYCKKYGYQGWHMLSGFRRGTDAQRFETMRKRAAAPLLKLTQALSGCSAAAAARAVSQFLTGCEAQKKLEAFCTSLDSPETRTEHAYFAQVFERTEEIISAVARAFGDMPMSAQTLCGLIKTGCTAAKIALIPPTTDAVALFDIATVRLPDIDVLFALGVQDGVWPARDDGPGILCAAERAALLEAGINVGVYDLSAEKLKVYSALVKPKKKLHISYNTQSAPAVIVDRVLRLFPCLETVKEVPPAVSLRGTRARVLGELASALRGRPPALWLNGLCAQHLRQPGFDAAARDMLLRGNAAQPLGQELAVRLYGGGGISATRVECFCRCPFRHFLDYGLRAQAEREYTRDVVDIGTFLHLALDIFARGLIRDKADMSALTAAEAERRMREAANEAAERHDYAKLTQDERFARQYALLTNELLNTAQRIRAHFTGSRASIYAAEQPFSGYTVQAASGEVAISGKIDRIDAAGGYFRVVDYKSSDTRFVPGDAAAGVSLQLPVYIDAARRLLEGTGLKPAGGYYMKIGDNYGENAQAVDKDARMKGISLNNAGVLGAFSAELDSGDFAAIDQSLKASGELSARGAARLYTEKEMDALLRLVGTRIVSAADAIFAGETAIAPVIGTSKGDVCEYCDYKSVCRMNAEYAGNAARVPEPFDREALCGETQNGQTVE